ncbi:MAG: hypothetical protein ACJ8CR_04650 [Roseiflexaceae bacterium]
MIVVIPMPSARADMPIRPYAMIPMRSTPATPAVIPMIPPRSMLATPRVDHADSNVVTLAIIGAIDAGDPWVAPTQ